MTDLITAIVLGLVQGITEWLPISSQGNVIAIAQFLGLSAETAFSYAVVLHIGTLIAAIIYFWKEIIQLLKFKNNSLLKFLAVAVIFTAPTAALSYFFIKSILETESIQIFGAEIFSQTIFLLLIGVLLIVTGLLQKKKKISEEGVLSKKNGFWLGLAQGFTVLPGLSRSGTTTAVLLAEKFSPEQAFRISFLLSIPSVLIGELSYKIAEAPVFDSAIIIGITIAAITGLVSIHILLKIAKRLNFRLFCFALAAFYLIVAIISIAVPFVA